ncbi:MAG: glycosyltransferase family 4 protein [Clostridiales bacterium]|nr:glycosyltransferase family 4 protein [Clostridiales bacterium]
MKVLLFGTGDYYQRYKKWFDRDEVLALLDNSPEKQNTLMDEISVLSPEEGVKLPYDVIVILSFYVTEMRRQLRKLGVPESVIYHFYDLNRLIYKKERKKPIEYYGGAERIVNSDRQSHKKILLLSHDLTLGGPPIALLNAAVILMQHGYQVVYASMIDGPLRAKLLSNHIPVIVDVNLQIETMREAAWTTGFSLMICNTINYHVFLSRRDESVPAVWWLHDASFFYHGVSPETLRSMSRTNLTVYSVGPIPQNAIHQFVPDLPVENLLYSVADSAGGTKRRKDLCDKVCFVTIGYIGEIKGHDILIEAVKQLRAEARERAVFCFVGPDTSVLAQNLKREAGEIPEIVITGAVGREAIHEILNSADALICPSREDSMPTVAAEAMMHGVPCILSDMTGTAGLIENGLNGLVFPGEDVISLAGQIDWCIEHREDLIRMGEKARIVYEKVFSMGAFEEKLMEIVENV